MKKLSPSVILLVVVCSLTALAAVNVASVFGRKGVVKAAKGDYSFSLISGRLTSAQMPLDWTPPPPANIQTAGSITSGYGANAASVFTLSDGATGSPTITVGVGSPEGVFSASPGSLRINTTPGAGSRLYLKDSGTGPYGWVAK